MMTLLHGIRQSVSVHVTWLLSYPYCASSTSLLYKEIVFLRCTFFNRWVLLNHIFITMQKKINSMEIMVSNIIGISVIIFTGCLEFQLSFINGIFQIKNALNVNVIIYIVLLYYYYYYYCIKFYIILYCVVCQIQRLRYPHFIDNLYLTQI